MRRDLPLRTAGRRAARPMRVAWWDMLLSGAALLVLAVAGLAGMLRSRRRGLAEADAEAGSAAEPDRPRPGRDVAMT